MDSLFYVVNSICFNNITGNEPNGVVVLDLLLNSGAISRDTAPANTSTVAPEKVPYAGSEMSYYGFQYNWWGDKSGPIDEEQGYLFSGRPGNLLGTGDKVVGFGIEDYAPGFPGLSTQLTPDLSGISTAISRRLEPVLHAIHAGRELLERHHQPGRKT